MELSCSDTLDSLVWEFLYNFFLHDLFIYWLFILLLPAQDCLVFFLILPHLLLLPGVLLPLTNSILVTEYKAPMGLFILAPVGGHSYSHSHCSLLPSSLLQHHHHHHLLHLHHHYSFLFLVDNFYFMSLVMFVDKQVKIIPFPVSWQTGNGIIFF